LGKASVSGVIFTASLGMVLSMVGVFCSGSLLYWFTKNATIRMQKHGQDEEQRGFEL
jgi:uncharacterized membrane protein YdjX (TVP38/TMEM64 family)